METVRIESIRDFTGVAQVNLTVIIRGKYHTVIDVSRDYTTNQNGTFEKMIILKEFFTGNILVILMDN